MLYATTQDMIDSFGEEELIRLTDMPAAPGVIDMAALGRALDRASAEIDGYVASRYPQPFSPVPRILIGVACDLARYRLMGVGGRLVSDEGRDRHKDAIKLLGMIADGKVKLGADATGEVTEFRDGVQFVARSSVLADALRDFP